MKDEHNEHDEFLERKMKMWKMRDELLNSMTEKELKAFIKGYMMGERNILRHLKQTEGCQGGSCQCGNCGEGSCKNEAGCQGKECNCGREQ